MIDLQRTQLYVRGQAFAEIAPPVADKLRKQEETHNSLSGFTA